jgi:sulfotransferase family protein
MAMLKRAMIEAKRALGLHSPGRNLAVFPDDTFLVSFPKSGNTWARFLIANLIRPNEKIDFSNVNSVIPGPEVTSNRDLLRVARPRIIKSHQYFDPRYKQVIYIARDPRDVVVSQYHFQRKRKLVDDSFPLTGFVEKFMAGETCFYGSWGEHIGSWLATRHGQRGFLLLRYEDMVADTPQELSKVAAFLNIAATSDRITQAVERSSADTMRVLEKSQAQLFTSTKDTRQDIPFVRAAKAGGWRSALPEESVARIEQAWGHLIQWLGYEMVTANNVEDAAAGSQADFLVGTRK